jgi:1-acylglycerone phosphate reductase
MPVLDLNLPAMRQVFELNVFAPLRVVQAFFPLLLAASSEPPGSSRPVIISHTSLAARKHGGLPWSGGYNASKAAAASLAYALRMEIDMFSIDVVEIQTGAVKSGFFANLAEAPRVPAGSYYEAGKGPVEKIMDGAIVGEPGNAQDGDAWARQVVGDVEQGRTLIMRGKNAGAVGWADLLGGLVPEWVWRKALMAFASVGEVQTLIQRSRSGNKEV